MTRIASLALLLLGASVCSTGAPEQWHSVYANEPWYQERTEPEREWHGTLQRRESVESPMGRTALRYALVTNDRSLAVYAPNDALERHAGATITVRGKLVQIDGKEELWIGTLKT